jgi:hypothetical protein
MEWLVCWNTAALGLWAFHSSARQTEATYIIPITAGAASLIRRCQIGLDPQQWSTQPTSAQR